MDSDHGCCPPRAGPLPPHGHSSLIFPMLTKSGTKDLLWISNWRTMLHTPWSEGKSYGSRLEADCFTDIIQLASFDDGEILPTPHFLVDAKLEDCKASFGGTFLLPSIRPEAGPERYVVVIDDSTGIYHVARGGPSMHNNVVKPVEYQRQSTARHVPTQKGNAAQLNRVVMPKGFDALSCVNYAKMPAFGSPRVDSSCAGTVSIMDSFKAVFAASRYNSAAHTTADSSIKALDSAIVAFEQSYQKLAPADTATSKNGGKAADTVFFESFLNKGRNAEKFSPTEKLCSLSVDSANRVFFESLLTRKPIVQTDTTADTLSSTSAQSADSVYFESLLTKKPNAHTAPPAFVCATTEGNSAKKLFLESLKTSVNLDSNSYGKVTQEVTEMSCNLLMLVKIGHVELEDTTTSNCAETPISASWPEHSAIEMSRSISSLDISLPYFVTKPRLLLSELNLDVTPEQTARLLKDAHHLVEHLDSATEPAIGCVERDEVRFYRPIAPRPDDMSYEDCLLSNSFATSESSETLVEEMELNRQPISTPLSSSSDNQMFHLLKQEPLEESRWIDLNEVFQTSEVAQTNSTKGIDLSLPFSQSVADTQEVGTDVASLRLPTTDKRQILRLVGGNDVENLPVVASSCNAMKLPAEPEEKEVRICLPGPPHHLPCSTSSLTQADLDEARQIAIKNLDLDAVFGESPRDWSDDPDLDDTEPDPESPAMSTDAAEAKENNKNIMDASSDHLGQTNVERTTDLDPDKYPSDVIVAGKAPPFKVCDRLPTSVIEAINLEQCRIWDSEGPWTMGSDEDETYEMAVENIRRVRDDVPEDILFWINEVNGEYTRLVVEGQATSGVWDADAQRKQLITLATSNVEWHYFHYCLEESPKVKPHQPISEISESPKDWIVKVLGGETRKSQDLISTMDIASVATEAKADAHDHEHLSPTNNNDSNVDEVATAAAASFRAIYGRKLNQLFDPNNPHGSTGPSMTPPVTPRHVAASSLAHSVSVEDETLETFEQAPEVAATATSVSKEPETDAHDEGTEVAAPVTPELLLKLPNRSHDTQHIKCPEPNEIAAPVTPALLLKLPNRANDTQHIRRPVAEPNTLETNAPEDEHEKEADVESSSISAGATARSSGTTSRSDAATDVTDLEDFDGSFTKRILVSKLRPHRFFDIEDSKAKASDISIFREQTAVQAVLDKIIMDLPDFTSEEDEDGAVDSDHFVEMLAL